MLYAIIAEDNINSLELRKKYSQAHRQRLHQLKADGRLVLAGPCPIADQDLSAQSGFSGSFIVIEFDSLEAAQDWANTDPFLIQGVYQKVTVKPFIQFLP